MSINSPTISMKSIYDLQEFHFLIPSYQRGYRWTKNQVVNLLEDIEKFHHDTAKTQTLTRDGNKTEYKFYCLQPLVVKRHEEENRTVWEVIDGQQRLTTILLIMRVLKQQLQATEVLPYAIEYATRTEAVSAFLQSIDLDEPAQSVDLFYMQTAVETINTWFAERRQLKLLWMQTLTNDSATGHNTRFIWYEIPAADDAINVFTRLNSGKIPLTNAELVRALFLGNSRINSSDSVNISTQLHIAENWDTYEQQLQNDAFWYFIHDSNNQPENRIEFIFEQLTDQFLSDAEIAKSVPAWANDQHRIFYYFNMKLNPQAEIEREKGLKSNPVDAWDDVRRLFLILDEWYNDRELYHLIGFLLHHGAKIHTLRSEAQNITKMEFVAFLKKRILAEVFPGAGTKESTISEYVHSLTYGSKKKELRSVLMLFNIVTLLSNEKSNIRFPFDSYKSQRWDIEHIKSSAERRPERREVQREWYEQIKLLFKKNAAFRQIVHEAVSSGAYPAAKQYLIALTDTGYQLDNTVQFAEFFDGFYDNVTRILDEGAESGNIDTIQNLTLLDYSTNRSYQNAPFLVKRDRILELDRGGVYVPLCTRNVFLKAYSTNLDQMLLWSLSDQEAYETEIINKLTNYLIGVN